MAEIKKTYTISIQMDAARQALADANAKLLELDEQLTGLDRNSDAAKKLVAQMAVAAKQVESLTAEVQGLEDGLDALKPGSIGALEAEVEELERAWKRTVKGTQEFDEALLALGRAQGELTAMQEAVDALNPKEQIPAFVDLANGIVGAFSVATAAATNWGGLSAESAQEVDAAMQKLLVVMSGFEAISKATSSETLANVKNMYALAKSYLFGAESASTASKITRAALISTGIGAIVVLVGLLVANWDTLTAKLGGSTKFFTKIREVASGVFEGILAYLKNLGGVVMKLWDGDFSGAVAKAKNVGKEVAAGYAKGVQEVLDDENRKLIAKQVEVQERLLRVQQAAGRDTTKLQREILANKIAALQNGTEEEKKVYADAQADLAAFDAAEGKKRKDALLAATLARINAVITLEQAKGQESYRDKLKQLETEKEALKKASVPDAAAIINKQSEIDNLVAQHKREGYEQARADLLDAQRKEVETLEKQGKDTLALRITQAQALLDFDRTDNKQQQKQKQDDAHQLALLLIEQGERERQILADQRAQREDVNQMGRDADAAFIEGTADYLHGVVVQSLQKKDFDIGATILTKVFGVKAEDVEGVKQRLNQAFTSIAESVGSMVNAMLTAGIDAADAQLQEAQTRLQELDSQLSDASSKRQSDEQALASASGARRTYLINKVNQERKAEQDLAAAKAKAAKDEQAAAKEKAKLEKEQQQIAAASSAIEATLLAIQAAQTIVKIASSGKFGWDNIALAIAGAATIAASIFTVKNAAKQFEGGGTLGADGILRGRTHAQGGIPFTVGGVPGFEAEHGEHLTPADATAHNGPLLEMLRTTGRRRPLNIFDFAQLTRAAHGSVAIVPPPSSNGYYAAGGRLTRSGAAMPLPTADDALIAQQQTNALLAQLVESNAATAQHTAATAQATTTTAGYGAPRLNIGPGEAESIEQQRQIAAQSRAAATLGTN